MAMLDLPATDESTPYQWERVTPDEPDHMPLTQRLMHVLADRTADAAAGKATFVSILGVERARAQADLLIRQAIAHLDLFEQRAELLREAARFVIARRT